MLKKFWNNIITSIKAKLILSYLFLIMIPITIAGIYINNYMHVTFKNEFLSVVNSYLQQADSNIASTVNICENIINAICSDKNTLDLIQTQKLDNVYIITTILEDRLPNLQAVKAHNNFIYRINISHGNNMIPNVKDYIYFDNNFNDSKFNISSNFLSNKNKFLLRANTFMEYKEAAPVYYNTLSNNNVNVFSIYCPIFSYFADRVVGVIEIQVTDTSLFQSINNNNSTGIYEIINIIDVDNKVLYSNLENFDHPVSIDLNSNQNYISYNDVKNNTRYQVVKHYIKSIKAWLVVYIPEDMIYLNNKYRYIIIIVTLTIFITLGIISYVISKLLLANLTELSKGINKIRQGSLDTKINIKANDEVGKISGSFNDMTDRIQSLMQNLQNSYKAEKEAIYKSIENQINPHFLCNALDMIRMTAEIKNEKEISNATSLLISYFMYNLSKKQTYVTLKDELKNVSDYIQITNIIKNRNIILNLSIDDELNDMISFYYILKFTLQPLVENSIKHGFKDKHDNCCISIHLGLKQNHLFISIEDNGIGIPEERMTELNSYLNINNIDYDFKTSGTGIGLRNIIERLYYNYKEDYDFVIKSYYHMGTLIKLKVPLIGHETALDL